MSAWLTPREAAAILGISRVSVSDLVRSGDLAARRLPRSPDFVRQKSCRHQQPVTARIVISGASVERRRVELAEKRACVRVRFDRASAMLREGARVMEVVRATGLVSSAVAKIRKRLGIPSRPPSERHRVASEMLKAGRPVMETARASGLSHASCSRLRKRLRAG